MYSKTIFPNKIIFWGSVWTWIWGGTLHTTTATLSNCCKYWTHLWILPEPQFGLLKKRKCFSLQGNEISLCNILWCSFTWEGNVFFLLPTCFCHAHPSHPTQLDQVFISDFDHGPAHKALWCLSQGHRARPVEKHSSEAWLVLDPRVDVYG